MTGEGGGKSADEAGSQLQHLVRGDLEEGDGVHRRKTRAIGEIPLMTVQPRTDRRGNEDSHWILDL